MGSWIARALAGRVRLRLLARPTSDLRPLEGAGLDFQRVEGDLLEPATLRPALEGADALIHAAGAISFDRREAARVYEANLVASLNLFRAAGAAGTPRIVHTASIFALGHAEGELAGEGSRFNAQRFMDIPYVRAKRELEVASLRLLDQGLPLVRLYPGLCLGPGDRNRSSTGIVAAWLRGQVPALVEGGICFIDVRDAAAAHVAALLHGEVGQRYLAPGYNLTHRDFFAALARLAGRRAPRLMVPQPLATLGATLLERLLPDPPLRRDEARLMGRRWWYDDQRSRAALGLEYRPLDETLRATLDDLLPAP